MAPASAALVIDWCGAQDRCTKNHYYHRNSSGVWTVLPYDLKDAFAMDERSAPGGGPRSGAGNCSAAGAPCGRGGSYCILSCSSFNSPLFCDRSHPQDIFVPDTSDAASTWNHLVDAVLSSARWRPR